MRMIDGDALTDYVNELYEYDICHDDADDYSAGRASAEHGILEKIREMPAIPVIPVKWLRDILQQAVDSGGRYRDVANGLGLVLAMWEEEQEAQDG